MPHYDELKGKVALITGAGSGIGRTTAIAFARQGANVVVSDINPDAGAETVKKITDAGAQAIFVATDVSKEIRSRRWSLKRWSDSAAWTSLSTTRD